MREPGGFALLAVMLTLALLGVIAAEFAFSMRLEATMVRSYRDEIVGRHLAEAAVQQAIREIITEAALVGLSDGVLTFFKSPTQALPRLTRSDVPLGRGTFTYRITDEEGRINLNTASPDQVDRLLLVLGVDKPARDTINDSLQDWKDPNDLKRVNGTESEDYEKLPVPYRARNGQLEDVAELLQIRGVTPELFFGKDDQPGLRDFVTVHGSGRVNINVNTAPPTVLKALGLSEDDVTEILVARSGAPYLSLPPKVGGRGLGVSSKMFRVEAEGLVNGEPVARVVAIIQKTSEAGRAAGTILSWNPVPGGGP